MSSKKSRMEKFSKKGMRFLKKKKIKKSAKMYLEHVKLLMEQSLEEDNDVYIAPVVISLTGVWVVLDSPAAVAIKDKLRQEKVPYVFYKLLTGIDEKNKELDFLIISVNSGGDRQWRIMQFFEIENNKIKWLKSVGREESVMKQEVEMRKTLNDPTKPLPFGTILIEEQLKVSKLMSDHYDKDVKKEVDPKNHIIVDFSKYYTEVGGEQVISFYCPHCGHTAQSKARTDPGQIFNPIHDSIDNMMLVQCIFCKNIIMGVDEFSTVNDDRIEFTPLIKTSQIMTKIFDISLQSSVDDAVQFVDAQKDKIEQSVKEVEEAFKTNPIYQGVSPTPDDTLRKEVEKEMMEILKQSKLEED